MTKKNKATKGKSKKVVLDWHAIAMKAVATRRRNQRAREQAAKQKAKAKAKAA